MKDLFPEYYLPKEDDLKDKWSSCLFVIDSNILLNFHRYPKQAGEDLFKLLEQIKDRLWIPHQCALEYQRERASVIAVQKKRFADVASLLNSIENKLKNEIDKLQLQKRHHIINPDPFLKKLSSLFGEYKEDLEKSNVDQPDVQDQDVIRERLDELLKGKIGIRPANQNYLDEIYQEGEQRYKLRMPPGYMDENKEVKGSLDDFIYGGLTYKKKFGDLILWKQMIEKIKKDENSSVIFITDDEKEDWWWIEKSQAKRKLGPRPELREEIRRLASAEFFYMYNTERFLKYGKEFLKIDIKEDSIEQAKEIRGQVFDDFRRKNLDQWEAVIKDIFGGSVPKRKVISEKEEIISILDTIGLYSNLNHTFLPIGGGMDLKETRKSFEKGCIELDFGGFCSIVMPDKLFFESFGTQYEFAYFRLEIKYLKPLDLFGELNEDSSVEEYVEVEAENYHHLSVLDSGYLGHDEHGREIPIPPGARKVMRHLKEGAFVIFAKSSTYNQISGTYDARHNKISADEFRDYIERMRLRFN